MDFSKMLEYAAFDRFVELEELFADIDQRVADGGCCHECENRDYFELVDEYSDLVKEYPYFRSV